MQRFAECFSELPDPRADNALHDLTEILFIALMATLCGATSCTDMALFARMKAYLWQDVLVLKNGLPSHDTFSRVFRMLDPKEFDTAFRRFMKAFAQGAKNQAAAWGDCARWQGTAARLRTRQELHAAGDGERLGGADAHGAGQCQAQQQRSRRRPAIARTSAAQGLRSHGRRAALPSRDGQSDRVARAATTCWR